MTPRSYPTLRAIRPCLLAARQVDPKIRDSIGSRAKR
jgi:hypothetical protein